MPAIALALETIYCKIMDAVFARWPAPAPTADQLRRCKLISHRGEHSAPGIKENTLAAFDKAAAAGVWGLELDLRWTADRVPVVLHDPDLKRIFGDRRRVDRMTFKDLRADFAPLPSLAEVVARYGGRCHLMIEIKKTDPLDQAAQNRTLHQILAPLEPAADYHFISLTPGMLSRIQDIPRQALVPIAYGRPGTLYRQVLDGFWGGLCGHYSLLGSAMIRRMHTLDKYVGSGYAASPNCLFREIHRGVDWIFSNHAAALQRIINGRIESS